ncbi:hypothetical protein E4U54_000273, partial [Claviceps lovelessii]
MSMLIAISLDLRVESVDGRWMVGQSPDQSSDQSSDQILIIGRRLGATLLAIQPDMSARSDKPKPTTPESSSPLPCLARMMNQMGAADRYSMVHGHHGLPRIPIPHHFPAIDMRFDDGDAAAVPTVRVFIAGGSYAGLSTAVNLLDVGRGVTPRMLEKKYEHHSDLGRV